MVRTEAGESFTAPFVVAASGICRRRWNPTSPGWPISAGRRCSPARWPKEGFDLTGKRVGVIGTGSTGVQLIPVVAQEAGSSLYFSVRPPTRCRGGCAGSSPASWTR